MEYKEIVSVTGEPGLFQLLSSKSDGAIVRSLDGKTTRFVPSRNHNFTPLESIEVFTTGENVPLSEVFKTMQEKEADNPVIEVGKDTAEIKQYFEKVYPELDKDRVYMSDMKKMLKWYPILKENDLLNFEEDTEEPDEEADKPEKPEAKADKGKKEAETAAKKDKDKAEEKPQKKSPKKEAAEKKPAQKQKKSSSTGKKSSSKKADTGKS